MNFTKVLYFEALESIFKARSGSTGRHQHSFPSNRTKLTFMGVTVTIVTRSLQKLEGFTRGNIKAPSYRFSAVPVRGSPTHNNSVPEGRLCRTAQPSKQTFFYLRSLQGRSHQFAFRLLGGHYTLAVLAARSPHADQRRRKV